MPLLGIYISASAENSVGCIEISRFVGIKRFLQALNLAQIWRKERGQGREAYLSLFARQTPFYGRFRRFGEEMQKQSGVLIVCRCSIALLR